MSRKGTIMRIALIAELILLFSGISSYAQSKNISLHLANEPLSKVLNAISKESDYRFIYQDNTMDITRKVSVSIDNASIESVLSRVLPSDVEYRISGRQVIITKAEKPKVENTNDVPQKLISSGTISDGQGPVIGAYVMETGTKNGVITDFDGHFSIEVSSPDAMLTVSSLGYRDQTLNAEFGRPMSIKMVEDMTKLDEVVVIGYGTQTKTSVTGSLSVVDTKALVSAPVASITNVLAGSVPGVSTVQTTGQPGEDAAAIYIRGTGSLSSSTSAPLILVDGVEREMSQIDPNEIENFSVLKDAASTAVFGVRGANGVILITTKRGKEGRPSISVSTNTGLQQPISFVSQTGSYEFARFWNMKMDNDGITDKSRYFTKEAIEAYRTGSDPIMYPNLNWRKLMFNDVFLQSKNNINISGGSERVKYFVSMGYLYQNGVVKQFDTLPYDNNYRYNRYNYRANIDVSLTKTTTLKLNIGGNVGKTQSPRTGADGNQWVYATIWSVPMAGPGFINGLRTTIPKGFIPDGIEMRDGYGTFYGYGYNQKFVTTLNIDAEIHQNLDMITKGLSLSVKGAYDNTFNLTKDRTSWGAEYQNAYYKSYLEDKTKPQTDPDYDKTILYVPTGTDYPLSYSESYGRDRNWYFEAKINYERTFGSGKEHRVSALLLYNMSRDYYPSFGSSDYKHIPRSYVGYVARATYGYKDKYLVDANIGYNGSENFAPGKTRYGLFPSISAGWVLTEEPWMKKVKFLDFLKIRASWGRVGNDISSYRFLYMPESWNSSGSYSFGVDNPTDQNAFEHSVPGNTGVSWETSDKQNYGFDTKMFSYRLSLGFDYFIEHRSGILLSPNSTPSVIAMTLPSMNIGKVDNKGYEISLGWNETTTHGVNWYVNATTSFARNKIIYMDEVLSQFSYQNQTGGSTGRYKGLYKFERLYQYSDFVDGGDGNMVLDPSLPQPVVKVYPGDAMYSDLNGDNIVDDNDKCITGYAPRPEYVFGLNGGLSYKGFSFTMQWAGATHVNKMMEIEYRIPYTNAGGRGLLQYFYDDCWTKENQNGTLPRAAETSEVWNAENSTLWLRDASYLRLKTLTLGYSFQSKGFLEKIGVKALNLSLSGYNLLTFTPLDFMDPESLTNNNGAYPLVKVYSFGLNISF